MERKFNENGIFTGIADAFCLTCKKYLKLNQASEHINEPDHQKTFQSSDYVDKYKEDSIRKVELGYYCEMCNVMMQNLARVGIHIYETTHVNNKIKQQLKESDTGVIVFDDILIEINAWNGMSDGSCLLCNVDYSNADDHRNEPAHILKLIQSKFELLKDKFIYRKIDDDSINCLICNTIVMENFKETHTNESKHQKNYIKCQMTKESKTKTGNCHNNNNVDKDSKESVTANDATAESLDTKNDLVKSKELASDTSKTQIVLFNKNVEETENKNDDELLPPAEAIKRAMKFAKDHELKYKRNSTYCKLCDVQMSSSLKMMKEHVAESSHTEKAGNKTTRKMNKVPQGCFVKIMQTIDNIFIHDIVLNDEICIEQLSFLLITIRNGVPKCLACEVTFNLGDIPEHVHNDKHIKAMEIMNVLTDFDSEFVREDMERKFNENGIFTGIADAFCLTCKKYLKLNQASEHINEPDHQKTFQSSDYVVKYREDGIRKVELGYYCEMCNVMMQNLARVGIHISETTHVNNKIKQQLKESDAGVIVFDDILIENNAWNGMADNSCFVCNVDYSNADDHRNEPAHILKLIQSKFELLKDKFIYRKIDDDSINCLICNTIVMEKFKEPHTNESEHQKNYVKCQMTKESKIKTGNCHNNNNIDKDLKESVTANDATAESLDTKNDSVKSEKLASDTSKTQIVVFNKNVVEETENKNEDELLSPAEAIKRAMKFAKDNELKYKRNSTYCKLCDIQMSSSLKMMKEHVAESSHTEKVGNKTTKKINKVLQNSFLKNYRKVNNGFIDDILLNDEEICIEELSFLLLSIHNGVLKCQVCQVTLNHVLNNGDIDKHLHSDKHVKAMDMMNVLTDFESEFVREVRSRGYHCGYCNVIEASLDSLENHLKSINHITKKTQVENRRQSYLHAMVEDRRRRELNFMGMFNLPFF